MNRLLDLQTFCRSTVAQKGLKDVLLTNTEWEEVKHIVMILAPFNKYTKCLQSTNVTLSDFFGYWTMLRIKLVKSEDVLSKNLLVEMNIHHEILMDNPTITGAVYLDPRYQRGLQDKKPLALHFLTNLYLKMKKVESHVDPENDEEPELSHAHDIGDEEAVDKSDSFEDMNSYLNTCSTVYGGLTEYTDQPDKSEKDFITDLLTDFDGANESLKSSIWEIWEKLKTKHPELYQLATVVFSIPPTQTTVERSFSALALVLTSHRTRLNDLTLQHILLIRLNQDIYHDL